ncbi:MAG: archaeosortase/exosortase family protein [Candidatus Bathyarchaeota archaeon]|nr:archaeosortase/exosortase family protein [Candidatus Bathyarchaeota archaeon]
MPKFLLKIKDYAVKLLPLAAFVVPLALLYLLNPGDTYLNLSGRESFDFMWKGRTFELFFIWLIALEFILSWETIKPQITRQDKARLIAAGVALLLPTVYVVLESYFGLNSAVAGWALQVGVAFAGSMPLAVEYLMFAVFFGVLVWLFFGKKGLASFALPTLFVALVGALYTVDNVFPYGTFTPFQLLVPTTASLAAGVLGAMGYVVVPGTDLATSMPTLQVTGALGTAKFAIAWPCAGIESLLIFTAVALLFLKRMRIDWKAKVGFFAFGAAVTYLINVLRIVTIFTVGMQFGENSHEVQMFHFYYGPLYAMTWIVAYPLLLLGVQALWLKRNNRIRIRQS